jgi:hypothetical protein
MCARNEMTHKNPPNYKDTIGVCKTPQALILKAFLLFKIE